MIMLVTGYNVVVVPRPGDGARNVDSGRSDGGDCSDKSLLGKSCR